jgi:hypothetical protein
MVSPNTVTPARMVQRPYAPARPVSASACIAIMARAKARAGTFRRMTPPISRPTVLVAAITATTSAAVSAPSRRLARR